MNPFKEFKHILEYHISERGIDDLPKRWKEKHRYYHNTNHLSQLIIDIEHNSRFNELNVFEKHALLVAAFFHDAIYDPKRTDNEDKSIKLFVSSYNGKNIKFMDVVCNLIETTKYRKRPTKLLEQIFWDADNAGFKKGYDHLMKIEKLIQKEYKHLPKEKFKEGKLKFLESCLGLFGASADKDIEKLIEYYKNKY